MSKVFSRLSTLLFHIDSVGEGNACQKTVYGRSFVCGCYLDGDSVCTERDWLWPGQQRVHVLVQASFFLCGSVFRFGKGARFRRVVICT